MSNLPPGQFEVPLNEDEVPLQEGADGFPVGFGPNSGRDNKSEPKKPTVHQVPMPPQAQSPEVSTYFSQNRQLEGQPSPPPGFHYDGLLNDIPSEFLQALEENPEADLANNSLYPPGLRQEMIDKWKERFGKSNVYLVTIVDHVYVFRAISRQEWAWIKQQGFDQETFENQMVWTTLLFPKVSAEVMQAWPAGIPSSITEYVMRFSGFSATATPIRL